jgi:hypothetical protein
MKIETPTAVFNFRIVTPLTAADWFRDTIISDDLPTENSSGESIVLGCKLGECVVTPCVRNLRDGNTLQPNPKSPTSWQADFEQTDSFT